MDDVYEIELSDTVTSATLPELEIPLTETPIEGETRVETLDKNVYVDQFARKRSWQHTFAYMSEENFNILKGFYDRQRTLWQFPTITITKLGVEDVVVDFESMTPRSIIDNCGTVERVSVSFRETVQMTQDSGSS